MRLPSAGDEETLTPNLTPMIDVLLVIALFFMGAARFSEDEQSLDLDLPGVSRAAAPAAEQQLVIEVPADGPLQFAGRTVPEESLDAELIAARESGAAVVTIRGAHDAAHGRMTQVYEACRAAGIHKVAIAVRGPQR